MLTHIHTEADLDAGARRARPGRPAVCRARGDSGAAAAAAAARRLCRARRHDRGAAAFDRQRRRDLGAARRRVRSARAGGHHARARRRGWRGSDCRRRKSARSRKSRAPSRAASLRSAALGDLAAEDAHAALTAIHGIGPWTADIYLLSCLGHADAWPAGDLALQEAARLAFGLARAADGEGDGAARRTVAAVARRGGARAVDLLSRRQRARRRAGPADKRHQADKPKGAMAAELDGPRLAPRSGAAQQLVVFLHGYGADGNDLIDIGRAWQQYLAAGGLRLAACAGAVRAGAGRAAMVSAHLPRSQRTLDRRQQGGADARALSRRRAWRATSCRPPRWRSSASARAP